MTSVEQQRSFATWVAPHLPALQRYAVALAGLHDSADLVQDALASAWEKRASFDAERGTVRVWLLAILHNQAVSRWRRDPGRKPLAPAPVGNDTYPELDTDLHRAIRSLPRRQKQTIYLYYYAGLSIDETAAVLRVAAGTVKFTLSTARKRLATLLGDEHED